MKHLHQPSWAPLLNLFCFWADSNLHHSVTFVEWGRWRLNWYLVVDSLAKEHPASPKSLAVPSEPLNPGAQLKTKYSNISYEIHKTFWGNKEDGSKCSTGKKYSRCSKGAQWKQHLKGEALLDSQQVYRVKVMTCSLRAAAPLCKFDCFRELLEEHAYWLSNRRNLSDLIPFIHSKEESNIRQKISGKPVSLIMTEPPG